MAGLISLPLPDQTLQIARVQANRYPNRQTSVDSDRVVDSPSEELHDVARSSYVGASAVFGANDCDVARLRLDAVIGYLDSDIPREVNDVGQRAVIADCSRAHWNS